MTWSFQLYSARKFQPWPEVLDLLADAGYGGTEGFPGIYEDPAAFRRELDRAGLSMLTGHFDLKMLEGDFDAALTIAKTLGMEMMVCSFLPPEMRPTDVAGWRDFGARLAKIGEAARDADLGFGWHNHDYELRPLPDGAVPLQLLLDAAPEIGWEIDVAWIVRAGGDPIEWIMDHDSRITAVHLKDVAREGENIDEDGWADLGDGTVDWPKLMKLLHDKTSAEYYVIEHDNPRDLERCVRRSLEAAEKYLRAAE
jgi:sugar phosphate isomerase/epimerase